MSSSSFSAPNPAPEMHHLSWAWGVTTCICQIQQALFAVPTTVSPKQPMASSRCGKLDRDTYPVGRPCVHVYVGVSAWWSRYCLPSWGLACKSRHPPGEDPLAVGALLTYAPRCLWTLVCPSTCPPVHPPVWHIVCHSFQLFSVLLLLNKGTRVCPLSQAVTKTGLWTSHQFFSVVYLYCFIWDITHTANIQLWKEIRNNFIFSIERKKHFKILV